MPTIDRQPPKTRSALTIASCLVRDADGPLHMEAARALRDAHDTIKELQGRIEYMEYAIESLSLHNGHLEIQRLGVVMSLQSWAEVVIRGD